MRENAGHTSIPDRACRKTRTVLPALAFALALCLGACGSSSGDSGSSEQGRGSVACQDWQDAICDFLVGCDYVSRSDCEKQNKGVVCKSDQQASDCSNALNSAGCVSPPANCEVGDIADPEPAIRMCDQMARAICRFAEECGTRATEQECLDEFMASLPCEDAVAITLDYEECMEEIELLSCKAAALPLICNYVVLIR